MSRAEQRSKRIRILMEQGYCHVMCQIDYVINVVYATVNCVKHFVI